MARQRLTSQIPFVETSASSMWLAWDSEAAVSGELRPTAAKAPVSPDELFVELDGTDFVASGQTWHVEIYSVIDDQGFRWVQLGVTGPRSEMATLRLAKGASGEHALIALTGWLSQRSLNAPIRIAV